jgi:small subunit ribosomal protein S17
MPEEENKQHEQEEAEETPAEDQSEETQPDEGGADEAEAQEAPAEEPAAEEPEADEAPAAEAPAAGDEEELSFKARRRLERSRRSGAPGPQRSPEERAAERTERRRQAKGARGRYRARRREKKGEPGQGTPPAERTLVPPKVRQGTVVSSKADKTIRVAVETARRHPAYEKIVRRSSTLHAHDEQNEANEGDRVRVVETRPLSRTKRWRLDEILERAK